MSLLSFDNFKGTAPRIDPHVLPDGFAQIAANTKLFRGILQAWKSPLTALATTTGINTIRRYPGGSAASNWITWSGVVESVINTHAGDTKNTIYWTDPTDGILKQSRNDKLVFASGYVKDSTDYFKVGAPAPTAAPTVAIDADAPDAARTVNYVYAWAHRGRIGGVSATISVSVTEKQTALLTGLDTAPNIAGSAWPNSSIEKFRKFIFKLDTSVTPNTYTLVGKIDNDADAWMDKGKTFPRKITSASFNGAALAAPAAGAAGEAVDFQILNKNDREYTYAFTYTDTTDGVRKITPKSTGVVLTDVKDGTYVQIYNMATSSGLSNARRIRKVIFRRDGLMTDFRAVAAIPENQAQYPDTTLRIKLGRKYSFWPVGAGLAPSIPSASTRKQFEQDLTKSSFYYVYTWVTGWGEESAPSPVSALIEPFPSDQVTVTLPTTAPTGYTNVTHKRVYRTDTTGSFRVLFDTDVPLATASVVDDVDEVELGETLKTTEWDVPPGDATNPLKGLCALPNNVMCAGWGNQIAFSEPGYPYAWPIGNQFTLDYNFVGAAVSANGVVVCTEGTPYLCQGNDPSAMAPIRIEQMQACVHRATIVDMGDFVVYASPDGLVAVSGGSAEVVTQELITKDQWQQYIYKADSSTSTLRAAMYERRYLMFYDNGASQGGLLFDPMEKSIVTFTLYATALHFDVTTDGLYLQIGTNIQKWDNGSALTYTWRSGRKLVDKAANFDSARIDASAYPVTFKLYADGVLKHTQTVADGRAFRLPSGYRAFAFEVELSGTADIRHVTLAQDIREMM